MMFLKPKQSKTGIYKFDLSDLRGPNHLFFISLAHPDVWILQKMFKNR